MTKPRCYPSARSMNAIRDRDNPPGPHLTIRRIGKYNVIYADGKPTQYEISRGAYIGTNDDRADRWYIEDMQADAVRRFGNGFATKAAALKHAQEIFR